MDPITIACVTFVCVLLFILGVLVYTLHVGCISICRNSDADKYLLPS